MTKNFLTTMVLMISLTGCKKSLTDNGIVNGSPACAEIEPHNELKDVTIITSASKSGNSDLFTWSASGGISDNGSWADNKVLWAAVRSPVVGTLHDTFTLYGNNGSIKLRFDGLLKPTADPDLFAIQGN